MTGSGYWVQPGQAPEDVITGLRRHGIDRPVMPGDPMDEAMPAETLRVVLQIGLEHLALRGGADVGDVATAEVINRGMLAYMNDRVREAGRHG